MEINLLLNKIRKIQTDYKNLLIDILNDLEGDCKDAARDEIVLFWTKNKPIVNMFLKYFLPNQDTFVMTGVTYLDIDAGEQYPFFLVGTTHILDDPLGKYCEICNCVEDEQKHPLRKEIIKCAKDDLKVLKDYPQIIVIPLRLFNENEQQDILKEVSERLFISLFSNISSITEYFKKIITVEDVQAGIKGYEHVVLLYDDDDTTLSFSTRFEKAKAYIKEWFSNDVTDSQAFFYLIRGYIYQALDIIMSCSEYSVIPYIRYRLVLNYYLLCAKVFEREMKIDSKSSFVRLANIIYKVADINKLKCKGDSKFFEAIKKINFWEGLKREALDVVTENSTIEKIAMIVENNLERLYSEIKIEN